MTEKELRRLNRRELLELLIEQVRKVNELQAQLDEANAKLESRQIQIASAGSIAEAALMLNHIFEDAQAAADLYLENIRAQHDDACAEKKQTQATPLPAEKEAGWVGPLDDLIGESGQGGKA